MKKALFLAVLIAAFMAPAYASWDRQDTEKHEKSRHTDINKKKTAVSLIKAVLNRRMTTITTGLKTTAAQPVQTEKNWISIIKNGKSLRRK